MVKPSEHCRFSLAPSPEEPKCIEHVQVGHVVLCVLCLSLPIDCCLLIKVYQAGGGGVRQHAHWKSGACHHAENR